jgi:hypothetical protein
MGTRVVQRWILPEDRNAFMYRGDLEWAEATTTR